MSPAPGTCYNREPAVAPAGLCSTETPKPGRRAPNLITRLQGRERRASSRPSLLPRAPSSSTLQLFGYTHPPGSQGWGFRRAGLEWHLPSRQRVAAPSVGPPGCSPLPSRWRYLPGQLSHLSSFKTSSPMALQGHTKQTGPRAAGAAAERAVSLQTLGRKAAFGPSLVSGVQKRRPQHGLTALLGWWCGQGWWAVTTPKPCLVPGEA